MRREMDKVEPRVCRKKGKRLDPTVPRNDEIRTGVSGCFATAARYPLDPSAIDHFLSIDYPGSISILFRRLR